MPSTFTASVDGLRLVKFVHWIIASGSSRSMATRAFECLSCWIISLLCSADLK
ncbi:hypothetical protein Pint_13515 [Pistacia integerrima]|uniref:Uncharacterized protein n=2 Tax=Pistacia TaxID=55512 RepID=A0ACC1ASF8_9ROSI|nr:hypothetical protein Pint_13515 [Pistacia integerrima]KAJ0089612.1 hypothetical protein Patl1_13606 [Pistacia atlantica]